MPKLFSKIATYCASRIAANLLLLGLQTPCLLSGSLLSSGLQATAEAQSVPAVAQKQAVQTAEVEVELASGRTFYGKVDARTNDQSLWLRAEGTATSIVRPILWSTIQAATLNGKSLTVAELQTQVAELKSEFQSTWPQTSEQSPHQDSQGTSEQTSDRAAAILGLKQTTVNKRQRDLGDIRSIRIDAHLANLDADAQPDGLRVRLYAQNEYGETIPPSGTLAVEVYGFKKTSFNGHPHGRGDRLDQLTRRVVRISADEIRADGSAVLPISFARTLPTDIATYGLVHAELVVPGQGVFEASRDAVRLQEFAPTRDALQRKGFRRTLATE